MENSLIYGLMFDCPCRDQKITCPMREIRELPLKERIEFVKNLPESKKMEICQEHNQCLNCIQPRLGK